MDPSSAILVLSGTEEELRSYRCLKVLCTSILTNTPLKRTPHPDISTLTPLAKSLCLTLPPTQTHIPTLPTILRTLSTLSPTSGLTGTGPHTDSPYDSYQIDSWISFISTSVETPLEALKLATTTPPPPNNNNLTQTVRADLQSSFRILERHLIHRTYFVGQSITIADIAACCAVSEAMHHGLWKDDDTTSFENLSRWYDTMTHQDWFLRARDMLSDLSSTTTVVATASSKPSQLYQRSRIRIKELLRSSLSSVGSTVTVKGWARTTRNANKGKLMFLELNDGSCGTGLQCLLEEGVTEGFDEAKNCGGTGASFDLRGDVVESPAKGQSIELRVTRSTLLGPVFGGDPSGSTVGAKLYPLSKKAHSLEYLRERAHLRPRARLHSAAMRIRHAMAYATHRFFHELGFLYIHTPIVTCADCEGAGEQFAVTTLLGSDPHKVGVELPKVKEEEKGEKEQQEEETKTLSKKEMKRLEKKKKKAAAATTTTTEPDPNQPTDEKIIGAVDYTNDFYSRRANLTVSGQLNVETHACALCDVYTFGPTFRAENSHTARHLSEFWMIEPEIAFADLEEDVNLAEDYLKYLVRYALEECGEDLEFFETSPFGEEGLRERLRNVLERPFKRITYTEAIEILQKAHTSGIKFEEKPEWGMDLPSEHERYLCEKVFQQPVVLTDYPKDIKAFYMKLNDDGKTVAAADILVPKIGEIIGGSQREHRLEVLKQRCEESRLDLKAVWWYLDLRKYGTVPHSGFGLGFERLILFVTGLDNIRDVIPFPRWPGNAEF